MNSLPQTSLVIESNYVAGIRYQRTPLTPADVVRADRRNALTKLFDRVLNDHDAMPERDLPRWDDPSPFRLDRVTPSQQLDRLYEALLHHVTERKEVVQDGRMEVYEMVFRVLGPATADPEAAYPSRFEGGPADSSTSTLPMVEIIRVESYADVEVKPLDEYPIVPTAPARYQFRGYDVLNRQAVYRYLGK